MSDFTPIHKPGQAITLTASVAVTGGQLLEVTGDLSVGPAAANSVKVVGQAGHDAAAGQRVTVHAPGSTVTEAETSAAVAAGASVKAAAAGKVTTFVVGTDPEPARIGLALAAAAVGAQCRYLYR